MVGVPEWEADHHHQREGVREGCRPAWRIHGAQGRRQPRCEGALARTAATRGSRHGLQASSPFRNVNKDESTGRGDCEPGLGEHGATHVGKGKQRSQSSATAPSPRRHTRYPKAFLYAKRGFLRDCSEGRDWLQRTMRPLTKSLLSATSRTSKKTALQNGQEPASEREDDSDAGLRMAVSRQIGLLQGPSRITLGSTEA